MLTNFINTEEVKNKGRSVIFQLNIKYIPTVTVKLSLLSALK